MFSKLNLRWALKRKSDQQLNFFADENFPVPLVKILNSFDGQSKVTALEEVIPRGTEDEEWLRVIGTWQPKPIVLGGDGRILKSAAKLAALKGANTHFVYLADGYPSLPWKDQVIKVLKSWDDICGAVTKEKEKTVFRVRMQGGIELWRRLSEFKIHGDLPKSGQAGA